MKKRKNRKNLLIIHRDLEHVSILAEIKIFGHTFNRKEPLNFAMAHNSDLVCAYLEIGKKCFLHEKEPMFNMVYGYQSDGNVIPLKLQGYAGIPNGIYPLKACKKSGEWARFFSYI